MSRTVGWIGLVGGLVLAGPLRPAWATVPGKCTVNSEVTSATMLATSPARVCQVEAFCTAAGWVQVFDAVAQSGSRVTVAEPGATAANGHAFADFGPEGYVTQFGLGVELASCRALIKWGP